MDVFVRADVGLEVLQRTCLEGLRPVWERWSYNYMLTEEDATLYVAVQGGNKLINGHEKCILDFFLKKSRSPTALPTYDFSSVLEVLFHLPSAFCEEVNVHRLLKESEAQVCWSDT